MYSSAWGNYFLSTALSLSTAFIYLICCDLISKGLSSCLSVLFLTSSLCLLCQWLYNQGEDGAVAEERQWRFWLCAEGSQRWDVWNKTSACRSNLTAMWRPVLSLFIASPAQTPIEEFTPTPAFPALQYLESVDEGGVAWRAGLRMGDFLIEVLSWFCSSNYFQASRFSVADLLPVSKVANSHPSLSSQVNGQNVVKVGHRQVVNMIRQGGNSLMVKVVMVTRNPDMDDGSRKKSKDEFTAPWGVAVGESWAWLTASPSPPPVPQQSKRLSTPAIALRSKSMTSELEEMGKHLAGMQKTVQT